MQHAHDEVTESDRAAAEAVSATSVSRWAIHRRMYDWVLSFAHKPYATGALAAMSFAESSFFPIPPDVLLGPMCLSRRERSWWYATVTTLASVAGALVGYAIGHYFWEATQGFWYDWVPGFTREKFEKVNGLYDAYGVWVLFAAAFTPIPYKVFTIAGGVFGQLLLPFVLVSLVGRGLRFYLVAAVFRFYGPRAVPLIDRYFNLLCVLFVLLLIGGFAAMKYLH